MSSFNSFTNSFSKTLSELSSTVSQKTQELSTNLPNLAQSTQRMVQERLGQVTDISQLPEEYLELEMKLDSIKQIYDNFLAVSSVYEQQSYDYPYVAKESLIEFSKTAASKVEELSHTSSAHEAQNILTTSSTQIKEPKTLNFALSKVALKSSEHLNQFNDNEAFKSSASALLNFSNIQAKIAQARLQQDLLIKQKFNDALRHDLATNIAKATKVRKEVQSKRLQYDIARTNLMNAKPEKEASLRVQMETLEDDFAQATEHATIVMQDVIDNSDIVSRVNELARAQLAYFELSSSLMKEFTEGSTSASIPAPPTTTETSEPIELDDDEDL